MGGYEAGIEAAAKAVENLWYRAGKPARREQAAEIVEAFLGEVGTVYTMTKDSEGPGWLADTLYVGMGGRLERLVPLRPKEGT